MLIILIGFLFPLTSSYPITGEFHKMSINSFTFGSCFYGRLSTRLDIFKTIDQQNSDLWLWLGDAAYVDKKAILDYYKSSHNVNFTQAEEIFNASKNNECN